MLFKIEKPDIQIDKENPELSKFIQHEKARIHNSESILQILDQLWILESDIASKHRKTRQIFSREQLAVLKAEYNKCQTWSQEKHEELAIQLETTIQKVYKWRYDKKNAINKKMSYLLRIGKRLE